METTIKEGYQVTSDFTSYRYTGNLKYHINTSAGISSQPVTLLGALVFTDCTTNDRIATPVVNLNCLEDYPLVLETTEWLDLGTMWSETISSGCREPELQIVAVLETAIPFTDPEEILFSAHYRTAISDLGMGTLPDNPYFGLSDEEIFAECDPPAPPPASDLELIRFCEFQYNAEGARFAEEVPEASNSSSRFNDHKLYPIPFSQSFQLTVPEQWTKQDIDLSLVDVLGRTVWRQQTSFPESGTYSFNENFDQLTPGNYMLKIRGQELTEVVINVQKY